ncbi:MAG: 2-dehydropantoate 2-reductase [Planctomycetota bacterium]|nr:2-dehydropantoate 2-reductase [Planctomycetota bacterium]
MTGESEKKRPRIAIVGAGPIGSILAAYIAGAADELAVVEIIPELAAALREKGMTVSGCASAATGPVRVVSSVAELRPLCPEIVFVAVKACSLGSVAPALKDALPGDSIVVSFQNGLDTEVELGERLGKDRMVRMIVNYAGNIVEPGHVKMSFFNKPNYVGAIERGDSAAAARIADLMNQVGLETKIVNDIRKYVWEKTILNSALSPLCALSRMTMKASMDFPDVFEIVVGVLKEGIAVARADGYEFGKDFLDFCIAYLRKAGHHKPSMLCDVEACRPTEIDYLSGRIAHYAQKYSLPAPINTTIAALVRGLEKTLLGR